MPVQKGSQLIVQLVGSRLVQSGDQGGHVCFEGLSVDGADVSRSMEHGQLFGARDIEIVENRKMIGGDTMLEDAVALPLYREPSQVCVRVGELAVTPPVQG